MSFKPWITIPAEDVRVKLPMGIHDGEIQIMFKNEKVIDNTIEQLQNLKELFKRREDQREWLIMIGN